MTVDLDDAKAVRDQDPGGMVAAVGGLGSLSGIGKELAEAITKKIIQGVQKITFGG